jgi:hypothetical protein
VQMDCVRVHFLEDTPLVEIDGDNAYNFIFRRHDRSWLA